METNDKLGHTLTDFYYSKSNHEIDFNCDQETRTLQTILKLKDGIKQGLTHAHKRRTYDPNYVTRANNIYTDARDINSIDQLRVRNYEELAGWYTDDYQDNFVEPFICQLPGRNKEEVWVYGYGYSDWDGATIFLEVCDKDEAIHKAKRCAERHAEECYEDWQQQEKEQCIADLRERLGELRGLIKDLVPVLRHQKQLLNVFNNPKQPALFQPDGIDMQAKIYAALVQRFCSLWGQRQDVLGELKEQ